MHNKYFTNVSITFFFPTATIHNLRNLTKVCHIMPLVCFGLRRISEHHRIWVFGTLIDIGTHSSGLIEEGRGDGEAVLQVDTEAERSGLPERVPPE